MKNFIKNSVHISEGNGMKKTVVCMFFDNFKKAELHCPIVLLLIELYYTVIE